VIILDEFIPSHKVPYYFSAADGLLLSYNKDFVVDSGVLLQGVGFDLPVIASNSGWIGKIVRENELGITFTPENSSSLRRAMTEFLELGGDNRYRMVRNVIRYAESLSRSNVVEEYINLFKKTIEISTL
jgi:glycosyltransferase involved in cell wall biosynthesis